MIQLQLVAVQSSCGLLTGPQPDFKTLLALGKGKHEHKVQSKIQRKYVNGLSVTRLSVHSIVGQRLREIQRVEE